MTTTDTVHPDLDVLRAALSNALAQVRLAGHMHSGLDGDYNTRTAVELALTGLGYELADELAEHIEDVSYDADDVARWVANGVSNYYEVTA